MFLGFPGGSDGKESTCNVGDLGSIPDLGRSPGQGNGNPLQYSCLENSMDRGAWLATVHGVRNESDTTLYIATCVHPLQGVVLLCTLLYTTHGVGLPRLISDKESACQCRRHKRCGFNPWVRKIPWRRKWQPTLVFLPGKFHGQRKLVGYNQWGIKESDMIEWLSTHTLYGVQNCSIFTSSPGCPEASVKAVAM